MGFIRQNIRRAWVFQSTSKLIAYLIILYLFQTSGVLISSPEITSNNNTRAEKPKGEVMTVSFCPPPPYRKLGCILLLVVVKKLKNFLWWLDPLF